MGQYLLSFLIFTPLAAAAVALVIPYSQKNVFRYIALGASAIQTLLLFAMMANMNGSGIQFAERANWISLSLGGWDLKAEYFVAVDGLSFPLIALSVFIMLIAVVSSWKTDNQVKGYFVLLLILNSAIIGSFAALDFLLFYLFFEFMLLPMFFLIGIWGGPKREYASIKFFLYTLLGSILILVVLIALYVSVHDPASGGKFVHTFNLLDMQRPTNFLSGSILDPKNPFVIAGLSARWWAFLFLLLGFAIKLPVVPVHTWLPDAHVEAPTPVSVILAALLLKIGGYGLLRIAVPIFPDAAMYFSEFIAFIGVLSIIYGALAAMSSKDLKRLIAYSSVSHMGFVMLGIASFATEGITGAVYQMVSHGIISALLFIIAGVLYDRTRDRRIANYSGLSSRMPYYFSFVLIAFFASMGLPGFSGFIAEVLVLLGAFKSNGLNSLIHESFAIIATLGLVFGAAYYLWTIQRMFLGPFDLKGDANPSSLTDLTRREFVMIIPLAIIAFILGIFPQLLLDWINPFAEHFVESVIRTGTQISPTLFNE